MLKNRLYGNDAEGFQSTGKLDLESIHDMDLRDMDREEMELEIATDVAAADEASQTVVEVQEAVEVLAESVEEMNPVEVGKAIGAIEDKLDTIAENVEEIVVDTEALVAGNLVAGVKQELEAISDKIKKAWEAVKTFFKTVWEKIKKMVRSVLIWVMDGSKKSKALLEKLNNVGAMKSDIKESSIADKIGSKFNMVYESGLTAAALGTIYSDLDVVDPASVATSATEPLSKLINSNKVKVDYNIGNNKVIVYRFNGSTAEFALVEEQVYAGMHKGSLTPVAAARTREAMAKDIKSGKGLPYIKEYLSKADGMINGIKKINADAGKTIIEMDKMLSQTADAVSFKQGMFKTIWSKTLGHKSADQYTAEENVKSIKTINTFTSKSITGALFGGLALIKEMNGIASIVLSCYESESK